MKGSGGCSRLPSFSWISLERARLEAVADGRQPSLDPIILDRSDGLRNVEGSGGGLDPSGLRDRDGHLWFSTLDGIAVVDPGSFRINRLAPKLLVQAAMLAGHPASFREDGALEVPAGTASIELAYTAFSFLVPQKVRFRYRLRGLENEWTDAGARRTAYYTRLHPGDYAFELLASNNDGVWTAAPASLPMSVAPFWWERESVRFSALALLILATGLGVRSAVLRRERARLQQLERERALERERSRIARDLHDDIGARLSNIAILAGTRASPERDARIVQAAGAAVETMDELVWAVNARNDTLESFANYVGQFAERPRGCAAGSIFLPSCPRDRSEPTPAATCTWPSRRPLTTR